MSLIPDKALYYAIYDREYGFEISFYDTIASCPANTNVNHIGDFPKQLGMSGYIGDGSNVGQTGHIAARYKVDYYTKPCGEDFIDESFKKMSQEEFCGAMKFIIGKYMDRIGKKDDPIQELYKIADYANRWHEAEKGRVIDTKA